MSRETMQAIVYTRYGAPDVLQVRQVDRVQPREDEILVQVHAATVTSGDWRLRKASPFIARLFNGLLKPKNTTPGNEFAGVVRAVGKAVRQCKVGDAVFGANMFGANAEYLCVRESAAVAAKPANMSFAEAAAVPNGALSALHFLRKAGIRAGQQVLVYGASGSVGSYAVQLAGYFGASVTAVCSSANAAMVKSLGAARVIEYNKEDFTNSGPMYDILFDTVGSIGYAQHKRVLKPSGIGVYAAFGLRRLFLMLWTALRGSRRVLCSVADAKKEDLLFLRELCEAGHIRPWIDRTYPLAQTAAAHRYVEQGHKKGNVVLSVKEQYA